MRKKMFLRGQVKEQIKKKLKSTDGVTILFALLGFMVAAMVSITIITAATSMAKRVHSDTAEEQTHLTLTSAAELVEAEMEKTTYTLVTKSEGGKTIETGTAEGTFGEEMEKLIGIVNQWYAGEDYTTWDPNMLTLSCSDFDSVRVSVQMDQNYDVIFVLSLDDIEHDASATALYLSINSSRKEVGSDTVITGWNKGTISGVKPENLKKGEN